MNLLLKLKKNIFLRKYSKSKNFRRFFEDVDLDTPIERATFTVFDTETTGLDLKRAELISVGALRIKEFQIDLSSAFQRFVKPSKLERSSVEIHGITWDELDKNGEKPEKVVGDFLDYAKGSILVGFNVEFDRKIIEKYTFEHFGIPLPNYRLDVFHLWKKKGGHGKDLKSIAEELHIPSVGVHSALDDAYITALIFLKLVYRMKAEPLRSLPLML